MENMGQVDSKFWKDKRVFVTGHTGFKGSWMTLWLQSLGAIVTGYSFEPNTSPNLFKLAAVEQRAKSIFADIRDFERLKLEICAAKPEIVIHMAAQALVRKSYDNPIMTYETNVMGTVHLLEAVRRVDSVRAVLIVTSDKCYENKEWQWGYRENDRIGGFDPYSNSKGCAELVTSAYRDSYFAANEYAKHGVALASARAGNVIGGGDWSADRLIPDVLRALSKGEIVKIRNSNSVRPWQHVLEPIAGYLMLSQALYEHGVEYAGPWNFGPLLGDTKSVDWVVTRICEIWGGEAAWETLQISQQHEAQYLKLDCTKAIDILKWMPRWDLETALLNVVEWHRKYLECCDMNEKTLQQINEYQSL